MTTRTTALLLLVLTTTPACTAPPAQPGPERWTRTGLLSDGVGWAMPPGWSETFDRRARMMHSPYPDGASCNVMLSSAPAVTGLSPAERRAALEAETAAVLAEPGVTRLEEWWAPIGAREAQHLVFDIDHVRPGGTAYARHIQVRVPRETDLVQLTCTSLRYTFPLRRGTFDEVIASLQVP